MFRTLTVALAAASLAAPVVAAETFATILAGSNEVPPNASPATGSSTVTVDGDLLSVSLVFAGLTGGPAAAGHIHCCVPAGVNTGVAVGFPDFPALTSGTYSRDFNLLDPAIYTASFRTANGGTATTARDALLTGLRAGLGYVNVHNGTFPGGEIRGQLAAVPEPAALALLGLGVLGLAAARRHGVSRR